MINVSKKYSVTLIYNNPDPTKGGIPRYTFEVINRIPANRIDMTPVYGMTAGQKLYNLLWGRRNYFYHHIKLISEINHFLQPELFFNIRGVKKIVTFHDLVILYGLFDVHNAYELVRKILLTKKFKEAIHFSDYFIANSIQTKRELENLGVDESKIKVINLGVDEKFKVIKKYEDRKNIFGYIGSFNPRKRVDKLLIDWKENFNIMRNFRLILHGWGGSHFESLYKSFNNKFNIVFGGKLPEEKIVDFLNSLKAFIFPSKYEGFGLPIIEAVACGTPTFIYKDSKISEEVRKYAFEIESIKEVPEILERIKINELIKKSEKVKREFNWDKTIEEITKVYKKI
jgi:glycosyltransferase involved in cell wall biosynthesis